MGRVQSDMEAEQSISVAPVPGSVRTARSFVRLFLDDPVPPSMAEVAVLLTSELVANAVLHAGPHARGAEIAVRVASTSEAVRVEVTDHSPTVPTVGDGALDKSGGRGILLVIRLASAWGVDPHGDGKTVWFSIDL
ncbi:MAG: ATP-binding region ATPase domain protein [Ilumatobacteraceae bacterium]|nr:ATP-binding region ATPase domain protein [Ilumatobacteraceae bacterium]